MDQAVARPGVLFFCDLRLPKLGLARPEAGESGDGIKRFNWRAGGNFAAIWPRCQCILTLASCSNDIYCARRPAVAQRIPGIPVPNDRSGMPPALSVPGLRAAASGVR